MVRRPLIKVVLTEAQRAVIAEILPEFADRLKLDQKHARTVSFHADELESIKRKAESPPSRPADGMKRNSLRHVVDAVRKALDDSAGIGSIPKSDRLYQFKITLLDSTPPIWRRIQVKNGTLDKLHEHIQTAMGWFNCHLHQFEIRNQRYGDPELLLNGLFDEHEYFVSTITKISEVVPKTGKRFQFLYEYDFGDGWQHEVLFEGCLPAAPGTKYPVCLEGERACPPEDVGGVWGYAEFLEAIADPEHEQHQDYLEWSGPFDPDAFDPIKVTKAMQRGLPNWRRG